MNPTSKKRSFRTLPATLAACGLALLPAFPVHACPFCSAAMQTLSQEIEAADVALIAELAVPMPTSAPTDDLGVEMAAAKFRVIEVLRGGDQLEGAKEIDVIYFGEEAPDKQFLITGLAGVTGPGLDWTTPIPLSEAAVGYVKQLLTAPVEGADRLAFFQAYLEHEDPLLAQDAYDEFARTPYADVVALGPRMDRQQLLAWINDSSVGPSSRRLFLTMLGICGLPDDVGMLEQLMNYDYQTMQPGVAAVAAVSGLTGPTVGIGLLDEILHAEERRKRESLDALIACYLKLKGPDGLALVDELFLGNPQVEYKHLHSAIMALRFHGEETDVLPRERLLTSMRLALDHRDFADQVIPDLTRWQDWEVMPRLVSMFKESEKDDWIRQPVVTYLLEAANAPGEVGEQAAAAIKELETLDPVTVDRARSLADFGMLARAAAPPAEAGDAGAAATAVAEPAADPPIAGVPETPETEEVASAADEPTADPPIAGVPETEEVASAAAVPATIAPAAAPPVAATAPTPPNRIKMIGVPLVAVVVLLAIFAVLLRGADPRSSDENS